MGADRFSGSNDRLLGIARTYAYRLGGFDRLNLALSPDQAGASSGSAKKPYNGKVVMTLTSADGKKGAFIGIVDSSQGLIGVYEVDGNKYNVICDESLNVHVNLAE
jgi:hypothetical protein